MINITTSPQITKIYLVTNCYNDPFKVYIGKTINCRKRPHMKKYGKDITYDYIDEINSLNYKDWEPLETFWIEYFRQLGFTIQNPNQKGGGGPSFLTTEQRNKITKGKIGKGIKPIIQYNLNGVFIKEWPSLTQIQNDMGFNLGFIANSCKNKNNKKTAYGFVWRSKGDDIGPNFKIPPHKKSKPILQYDLEGNFIQEWENASIIALYLNIKYSTRISKCCRGELKKSCGFIWKFKI